MSQPQGKEAWFSVKIIFATTRILVTFAPSLLSSSLCYCPLASYRALPLLASSLLTAGRDDDDARAHSRLRSLPRLRRLDQLCASRMQ